ncbi:MAG: hypothetical protein C4527_25820 [Candidatus Omnitrophota bacterium]|jgi:uroporphyrinogen decarboxylase|nr:MAG: hypothetical protein C4527_25820 [Candidatus Omnitrophota bacterium]
MKIPFTPAVYEHAARLVNRSPWEASRDPDLLFAGHRAAFLAYHHTPVVVGIDIYNLEAEAYGATISVPHGNGIPAVHEPLFPTLEEALQIKPFDPQKDGRIPMVIEVAKRLAAELPDADVRIPVAGPFSIAFNLRGINNLCEDVALRPRDVAQFLMTLAENQAAFCRAVVDAGLDVAFFESAAAPPMLSPGQFRAIELPALKRIISLAETIVHHPVPCIMGGDTVLILDDILSTGTGFMVCNVETDQKAFVEKARQTHPHVKIRVNMDPTVVACNEPDRIYREIDRILALTKDHPNCLLGTGCLPYETPPENVRLIKEYVS